MSNASRIVDKLEQKGMVMREQSKKDRRAVDVLITQKSLTILEKLDIEMERWEKTLTGITEKEAKQLNELVDKLRVNQS